MGPITSLDDFIDMVRRRARLLALVSTAGCVLSVLYALSQPRLYQSVEVIQVLHPYIGDVLAGPGEMAEVGPPVRRLPLIEQRLLTRENLLEIIDGYNLYAQFPDMTAGEMVDRLRGSVQVHGLVTDLAGRDRLAILSLTVEMPIALQAQHVAHELADRAIHHSVTSRVEQAQVGLVFLVTQEARLRKELVALEAHLFKLHGQTVLPVPGKDRDLIAAKRKQRQLRDEIDMVSVRISEADMRLRLETDPSATREMVIDPAALPDRPVLGNRRHVAITGIALSVLLAHVLAYLLELRHPVIRTAQQMERMAGFTPFVSIPYLDPTPARRASRWQRFWDWADGPAPSDGPRT